MSLSGPGPGDIAPAPAPAPAPRAAPAPAPAPAPRAAPAPAPRTPGVAEALDRAWAVLLALVPLAVFAPTLAFGFVTWDDPLYVLDNPTVASPRLLSLDLWLTPRVGYPVPLPMLSYVLNHALHGTAPFGYHLVNVLLHALNVVLAARVLERAGLPRAWARVGALVFAVHPLVVEPVAWVTGRKDLLATAFALAALDRWLRAPVTRRDDLVGLALFACAALSKPSVWALPLLLALMPRARRRSFAVLASGAAIAAALVLSIVLVHPGRILDSGHDPAYPLHAYVDRLSEAPLRFLRALGVKLTLLVRPHELRPLYILPDPRWLETGTLLGAAAVVGLALAALVRRVRAARAYPLLLVLAATLLPPAMNVMHRNHEIGDSHLYLSLVPIGGLVALALARLTAGLRRPVRAIVAAALPVCLLPLALEQAGIWRDSVTFWTRVFHLYPDQPLACQTLGVAHAEAGRPGEALALFEGCARVHRDRRFYLHNMVVAAKEAGDPRFEALLAELFVTVPDDELVQQARDRAARSGGATTGSAGAGALRHREDP